jgi:hypothetical protein
VLVRNPRDFFAQQGTYVRGAQDAGTAEVPTA